MIDHIPVHCHTAIVTVSDVFTLETIRLGPFTSACFVPSWEWDHSHLRPYVRGTIRLWGNSLCLELYAYGSARRGAKRSVSGRIAVLELSPSAGRAI
jgi:hypothetical protein